MNGIIVIDKPVGITSRDLVNEISKKLRTKKVGHTGTLDPIASGVLVICVGKATKLVDILTCNDKTYVATCMLGISTDTIDNIGKVLKEENVDINVDEIKKVIDNFKCSYEQEVPIYSAVKINGKKLYEYARSGEIVELPKRNVTVYDIKLIDDIKKSDGKIEFKFECTVSKGTYIRSLIRDIAKKLNTVGIMTDLRRTRQGKFKIEDAYKIEEVNENCLIRIKDVLDCEKVELEKELELKVLNGAKVNNTYKTEQVLFIKDNEEIALYKKDSEDNNKLKVDKMFGGII